MRNIISVSFALLLIAAVNVSAQSDDKAATTNQEENKMIQMLGRFHMKPTGKAEFKEAMMEVRKGTEHEAGSLGIRMFSDTNNPDLLFGYERFKDFTAVEYHRAQAYELALANIVDSTLQEPPKAYVLGPAVANEVVAPRERLVGEDELFVVALFDIKPSQWDRVIAQYEKQILNIRAQDSNISFNVYPVVDNPTQLVAIEWWKSKEAARDFSTTNPLSMETGQVLTESLERPIAEYLHELNELKP
ncbi:putative quinol monooxygenase [Granulosicoccus antarcticus]|uniref:ABM domain-containing protein n=1 Tax=Granulosicoccus antarcticus IMCC3135 TaxID=1192854 RepID=A0A2Z2NWJ7_9GAMM|nr:antibiotic biosynthesis monooxygenase [Granulosicoccus antarcticus]ASJ75719.1 hypothetical protein IMCC3135_28335 [Granulosicoccus antarcticus IMCC3135]